MGLNRDEAEGEPVVEIGWSIAPVTLGRGVRPRGGAGLFSTGASSACGLERIVWFTVPDNERSRRVMEKIGMTFDREFERRGLLHLLYEGIRPGARFKSMLSAGDAAPDFTLRDQNGEDVTLSDLRGQTVVPYFYPRADSLQCKSSTPETLPGKLGGLCAPTQRSRRGTGGAL